MIYDRAGFGSEMLELRKFWLQPTKDGRTLLGHNSLIHSEAQRLQAEQDCGDRDFDTSHAATWVMPYPAAADVMKSSCL